MADPAGLTGSSSARPYRGVKAAERLAERRRRLLAAGLDLLGSEQQDISGLTVRAVCRNAGLASRYFYESFADKDEFVAGVFDWVVAELATTTQAAVAAVPAHEQARAGMANIVRTIADDPRIGRLLFSTQLADAVVVRKRAESTALFAMLSGRHAIDVLRAPADEAITAAAHFVVGGVGQTISAWLAGDVRLQPDQLVDLLASLLNELADPNLVRPRVTAAAPPDAAASRAATGASG
ncbi:TetR/AcrR family transcriptional regulator [Mycobacterium shinjukuense]|uniref:Transcriptional regulator n=1 Tax=Mycobacterium shinjukuense TaxID=398694 RepID=A0A7I7MTW2_9MYCO|nr:TetR/AcrR family transcriptional regulator [Mycobacterium shinjukuense]MCV6986206.1 TetR/AcrR family transcriptional regulator [Mycobacterium shinjukuense]ORB72274.1 TetR family transcriptional regulator [Mycobacterium shinjukuense]BBX75297.1 transcriptional regulator [Mycobacterium shinjukuense]